MADEFGLRIGGRLGAGAAGRAADVGRRRGHFERQAEGARERVRVAHQERARRFLLQHVDGCAMTTKEYNQRFVPLSSYCSLLSLVPIGFH